MKKIVLTSIVSLYLATGLCNIGAKFLWDDPKSTQAIASEIAPLETIVSVPLQEVEIEDNYCSSEKIYYLIDKSINKRRDTLPKYLDRDFFRGIVFIESSDNPRALSSAEARGLMQLTSDAWKQVEPEQSYVKNVYTPERNIQAGIDYFIWLNNYCSSQHEHWAFLPDDERRNILSASYNGGVGRLVGLDWDISQMPQSTQDYVLKIDKQMNPQG